MRSGVLANAIERVHLSICKKLLGVKKLMQNDNIYGEFGRISYQTKMYFIIIKYWFKILSAHNNKYIKMVYELLLRDTELLPKKFNRASLVPLLIMTLGFMMSGWVRGWVIMTYLCQLLNKDSLIILFKIGIPD